MTTVYSLNLSDPQFGLLSHAPFRFADKTVEIQKLEDVPTEGAAIIYILAHAVPNAFRAGPGEAILSENKVASILKQRRDGVPTLLIIDACFAETFQELAEDKSWPSQLGFIFSCRRFERSWHSDVSLFSLSLTEVMNGSLASESFANLESELQKKLGNLQSPVVVARVELLNEILSSLKAA